MPNIHFSFMELGDIRESATVLSLAMLNNPLHRAVFLGNGETQRLAIERMFFELFQELPGIVVLAKEHGNIIGVMRMKSCQGRKAPDAPKGPNNRNDSGWRKYAWHSEWAHHDPPEQHWHLGPIGVLPAHQGAGIGSLLMQRFCREVDACFATAYLETDLEKNVRFYEKFGFAAVAESEIFDVKNHYMVRKPAA